MAKRNYTTEALEQITQTIEKIDNADVSPVKEFFSDLLLRIGQFLELFTVEQYEENMQKWYDIVLDSHNYTISEVKDIFRAVGETENEYQKIMSDAVSGISSFRSTLNTLRDVISGKITLADGKVAADRYLAAGKSSLITACDTILTKVQQEALWDASKDLFGDAIKLGLARIKLIKGGDVSDYKNLADTYLATWCDLLAKNEMSLMNSEKTISLSWNFTSQSLQASPLLLDYACHTGRLYEYRVGDGEWMSVVDGQPIDVRRLFLGWHQLTVRVMGLQGTETEYHLMVFPSFWACIELILLILVGVSLMVSLHFRKNTKLLLRERKEMEDALIESETLRIQNEEFISKQEALTLKYQKVRLDEGECADIVARMKEYVERERVYTDSDLKMKDLADVLHLSAPKLSQVFNLYLKENYYEYINRYRLEEFKRLIDAGEYKRYTITALSEQCGFKKSNFFSTFRKVEGMTPAEYLKKRGVKV